MGNDSEGWEGEKGQIKSRRGKGAVKGGGVGRGGVVKEQRRIR